MYIYIYIYIYIKNQRAFTARIQFNPSLRLFISAITLAKSSRRHSVSAIWNFLNTVSNSSKHILIGEYLEKLSFFYLFSTYINMRMIFLYFSLSLGSSPFERIAKAGNPYKKWFLFMGHRLCRMHLLQKCKEPTRMGVQGMTLNCVLWWGGSIWVFGESGYHFIVITLRPTLTQSTRFPFMGQIELFKNHLFSKGLYALQNLFRDNYTKMYIWMYNEIIL